MVVSVAVWDFKLLSVMTFWESCIVWNLEGEKFLVTCGDCSAWSGAGNSFSWMDDLHHWEVSCLHDISEKMKCHHMSSKLFWHCAMVWLLHHLLYKLHVMDLSCRCLFVPDSPYRTAISGAVLKLQEEGKLHILKTRWWKEKRGGGSCRVSTVTQPPSVMFCYSAVLPSSCLFMFQDDTSKSSSAANELGLANVGGVFVVLMGGMGVACVIAVCEFVWKSRKVAMEERVRNILQDT